MIFYEDHEAGAVEMVDIGNNGKIRRVGPGEFTTATTGVTEIFVHAIGTDAVVFGFSNGDLRFVRRAFVDAVCGYVRSEEGSGTDEESSVCAAQFGGISTSGFSDELLFIPVHNALNPGRNVVGILWVRIPVEGVEDELAAVIIDIGEPGELNLFEVAHADGALAERFGAREGWKQERCEDSDDSNDDEKFDQSEAADLFASSAHTQKS
jgi:hypothetical protein